MAAVKPANREPTAADYSAGLRYIVNYVCKTFNIACAMLEVFLIEKILGVV